ncbi:hypothetical protein DFH09DRAFT_1158398, partial [Mycena vulgaris]
RCDTSPTPLHGPDTSTARPIFGHDARSILSRSRRNKSTYGTGATNVLAWMSHPRLASSWRAHPCASQTVRRVSSSTSHDRPPSHPSYDSHVRLTSPTPSPAPSVSGVLQRSLHHVSRLPAAPAAISSARTPPAMRREPTYRSTARRMHCDVCTPSPHPVSLVTRAACDAGAPARRRRLRCVPVHPDSLPPIAPRWSQPTSAVHRKSRCATPASAASAPLQPRPLPRLPALCDPSLENSARTRSTLGYRPP